VFVSINTFCLFHCIDGFAYTEQFLVGTARCTKHALPLNLSCMLSSMFKISYLHNEVSSYLSWVLLRIPATAVMPVAVLGLLEVINLIAPYLPCRFCVHIQTAPTNEYLIAMARRMRQKVL